MPLIDDRTTNRNYAKPNALNNLSEDVARLRSALDAIDSDTNARNLSSVGAGTAALGTSAIASGASASAVTVASANVLSTDIVDWGFNQNPNSVTGYNAASVTGCLVITAYPTAGNVNFVVSNPTLASITPGALTLNWAVRRAL